MIDFAGLVTVINNQLADYSRGLAIINCNLYGGMKYLFNLEFNLLTCE